MYVCNISPDMLCIQGFDLFWIHRISINSIRFNSIVYVCPQPKHEVIYLQYMYVHRPNVQ